jgi:hypothetical protein
MAGATKRNVMAGPSPRAFFVDPREERNDRAGADCQKKTRQGRGRIGNIFWCVAPEVACDGLFRDQRGHCAGDVEGGQQAEQNVRGEVGGKVAKPAREQISEQVHVVFTFRVAAGIREGEHCGHSQDGFVCVLMREETVSAESPLRVAEAVIRSSNEASFRL